MTEWSLTHRPSCHGIKVGYPVPPIPKGRTPMRRILVSLPLLLLPLLFALPALAGDWGENWGTLTWGAAIAAVPSMGKLAVLVLVLGLGGLAARFIQRGRAA